MKPKSYSIFNTYLNPMFILRVLYGIFLIIMGILVLKNRRTVKQWMGNIGWAEQYIGRGGTYLVIIIFGVALIVFGTIYPFGGYELLTGGK